MKTTIDIPGELYRRVKAHSALKGLRIRELTIELYRRWLAETEGGSTAQSPESWLKEWVRLGEEAPRSAPPSLTATEILAEAPSRLEER